ncbi:TVP38/TMEM64 family protein [Pseudoramibacter sp.]|jgi:uncharacterized membrane protein YdjX (TVP38/TMEM64 family)|uniref:TVP38/TMEM64 family protein n=1 Tax=Pseudoramibacter sp. TaxID=2034862 RepID=UPI0025DB2E2D|nr:VTT domain-containing protein [Pseudoramibacter sp.]MCH4071534.1 VTT domain-containing protein [Pseudoramibacter sp.]MCH4105302.1 VTT domain-containing protein [Pseudoramibacter sp.]
MFSIFRTLTSLRNFLLGFGFWSPLVFLVLQIVQVVIAPIPGGPLTILGGLLFGWWKGFLLSSFGEIFGSCLGFMLARRIGASFVRRFDQKGWMRQLTHLKPEKLNFVLFMIFILPGFPDDLACLAVGLTAMPFSTFLKLCLLGRLPGFLFNSLIGAGIVSDNPMNTVIFLAVYLALIALLYILFHKRTQLLIKKHQQNSAK